MANLIIGFPNEIDNSTLTGGSWQASLPLTNLQDRRLSKIARSTNDDAASTKFDINLGSDKQVRMICLVKHNLSLTATYRIRGSLLSDFSTTVYDSGTLDVYEAVFDTLSLEWEDNNWWEGTPSQEYIDEIYATGTASLIHIMDSVQLARYWRIEIIDTSNIDGYVELGRVFISGQWSVTNNILYGASLGYETNTGVEESLDGTEYFDVRRSFRNFTFELESYNYNEGHQKLLDISRKVGIDKEVFIVPDPDDLQNMDRRAFLGRLKTLNPIQYPYFNTNKAGFEVKEIT